MFLKENKVTTEAAERAFDVLNKFNPGQVVPWHEIESAAGFDRKDKNWSGFWAKLRKKYRERTGRTLTLLVVPGVGPRIPTSSDLIHSLPEKRGKKSARQLSSSVRELKAVRDKDLTVAQRSARDFKVEAVRANLSRVRKGNKTVTTMIDSQRRG